MNTFRITIAIVAVATLITISPANATADEGNKKTIVTFNQPVEIPGMVLPAGTYVFSRVSSVNPNVVRITSVDDTHIYALLLTIPEYRMKPADKTVITFEERPNGSPQAIKSWFYPGDTTGEEFVYNFSSRAKGEIAAIQTQIAEFRDRQAQETERIDAVNQRAREGLVEANRAAVTAVTASQRLTATERTAADADRRAEAALFTAKSAVNQIDAVAAQLESQIANIDKYAVADWATVTFAFDSDALTNQDMSKLDDVAASVSAAQDGYLIELQGFHRQHRNRKIQPRS